MAATRRGNFWLLITATVLCCFVYPIPFLVLTLRVKVRWLWYVLAGGVVTIMLTFVAVGTAPRVPDPTSSSGTRTETTVFSGIAVSLFSAMWIATLVIMFLQRRAYEESFLREGKSLDLATPGVQPLGPTPPQPPAPRQAPGQRAGSAFQLRTKRADAEARPAPLTSPTTPPSTSTVDINTATPADLVGLGISDVSAAAIIARRGQLGGFSAAMQVQAVPGLAPHEWVRLRDRLSFGSASAAQAGSDDGAAQDSGTRDDEGPRPGGRVVDI